MIGPRIVTALVLISLSVGCKAKFKSVNKPAEPSASANGTYTTPPPPPPRDNQSTTTQPNQNPPPLPPPADSVTPQQPPGPKVPPAAPVPQNPPPVLPPNRPVTPAPGGCDTRNDNTLDPARSIQRNSVTFRQIVVEEDDCFFDLPGSVQHSHLETEKTITLRLGRAQGSLSVYNRTTCHAGPDPIINPNGKGEYRLKLSTRKSDKGIYVRRGLNYIDYEAGPHKGTLVLLVKIEGKAKH
jgi:hypothetical protein